MIGPPKIDASNVTEDGIRSAQPRRQSAQLTQSGRWPCAQGKLNRRKIGLEGKWYGDFTLRWGPFDRSSLPQRLQRTKDQGTCLAGSAAENAGFSRGQHGQWAPVRDQSNA